MNFYGEMYRAYVELYDGAPIASDSSEGEDEEEAEQDAEASSLAGSNDQMSESEEEGGEEPEPSSDQQKTSATESPNAQTSPIAAISAPTTTTTAASAVNAPSGTIVDPTKLTWGALGQNLPPSNIEFKKRLSRRYLPHGLESDEDFVAYCFQRFFTDDMLTMLVKESNDYAHNHVVKTKWAKRIVERPITLSDMRVFLGLRVALGLVRSCEMKDLYSSRFPYQFKGKGLMPKRRFEDINSSLHCQKDDPTALADPYKGKKVPASWKYDASKEPKFGKFFALFLDACRGNRQYDLPQELTLDEMMIRFQGSSVRVFKRQAKPTSMGMKIVAVTDFNGFLVSAMLERGPDLGLPIHDMVVQLCSKLDQGHKVYMDNLYCT
ncbi:MAG TPA: hypothetical protein VEF04_05915, partial [Blastocatellia bacterium]|nr:hypothetical protein [Blastocatellia bacterium]